MTTFTKGVTMNSDNAGKGLGCGSGFGLDLVSSPGGLGDVSPSKDFSGGDIGPHACLNPKTALHQKHKNTQLQNNNCEPTNKTPITSTCQKLTPSDPKTITQESNQMNTNEKKSGEPKVIATYVRLNKDEHAKFLAAATALGITIPQLIKKVMLHGPLPAPLMSANDHQVISTQLARIGNNVNQIARKVNTGFREGFVREFEALQNDFNALFAFLMGRKEQRQRN